MEQLSDAIGPSNSADERPPLDGARILIAEDEVIIALELQDIVTDAGAEYVAIVHTIKDALATIEQETISACVLDVRLGITSIDPVARLLTRRGVPFLFYTGQPIADPARAPWRHVPTLEKPVSTFKLVSAIHDLLRTQAVRA